MQTLNWRYHYKLTWWTDSKEFLLSRNSSKTKPQFQVDNSMLTRTKMNLNVTTFDNTSYLYQSK